MKLQARQGIQNGAEEPGFWSEENPCLNLEFIPSSQVPLHLLVNHSQLHFPTLKKRDKNNTCGCCKDEKRWLCHNKAGFKQSFDSYYYCYYQSHLFKCADQLRPMLCYVTKAIQVGWAAVLVIILLCSKIIFT